jgi:hypothetical protein
MTSILNQQSSYGSVVFTTNIPGGKEYTLDPKDILYSDNLNFKTINTTNKLFYNSDKIINHEYLQSQTRSNLLNILFNKKRFEKITENNFTDASELEQEQIVAGNVISYIENIFTTFPKSYNIKKTSDINNKGGLKFLSTFENIPYTYLTVNGTIHTVSRVVYYDDIKTERVTLELLNDYSEFLKWYKDKDTFKVYTNPLIKDFNKLFNEKVRYSNLLNTFGNEASDNNDFDTVINDFDTVIQQYSEYIKSIKEYISKSKDTPSNNWSAKKFNTYFFGLDILSDDTLIMQKINKQLTSENKNSVNKLLSFFKDAVKKNDNSILTISGMLNIKEDKHLNKFKELVKTLNNDIKEAIGGEKWKDYLWVDNEPHNMAIPQNAVIPLTKSMLTHDLEKEIKGSESRIKIFEKQKEEYFKFNKSNNSGSLMIAKMMSNLIGYKYKNTVKSTRTDEEINNFKNAIETIFNNYESLLILNDKLKNVSTTNDIDDYINKSYKISRIISDQLEQIKKPFALSNSLFPSNKFKDILKLLYSFQTHYKIFDSLKNKMYNVDLLDTKYNNYTRYKEYVDFIRKIKKIYGENDDFKLADLNKMIVEGELVILRNNSGFENKSIRLHIDLIKGKVSDETIKQISCEYKDYDMVDRWNKLDVIDDDSNEIKHMHYFAIEDNGHKQIKNGGKQTKKYRRKKRIQTRKR